MSDLIYCVAELTELRENMRIFLILLVLLSSFFVFAEESSEKDRLAVMNVADQDGLFNEKAEANITDYIFDKLTKTKLYWMIPKSDTNAALEQAIEQTAIDSRKECVDEKCQIIITAQLQANFLINTKIKKLYQGTCQISISKFDVEKRAGVQAWEEKFDCTEKDLYKTVDNFDLGKEEALFKTGKLGKLEKEWRPDMAGKGDQVLVYFESDPIGATVYVDGVILGKTPEVKSKLIASGKHLFRMDKEGYYSEGIITEVVRGSIVKLTLHPPISINTDPEGAIVLIDENLICQETPCNKVIEEGVHKITVQKDLYATKEQLITVEKGKDINISLEPNFGWLEIESEFSGVKVSLDGVFIGKTPVDRIQISPGKHRLDLAGDCFYTVDEQFVIMKGQTHKTKLAVQPKKSAIQVDAKDEFDNDIEANVAVDGRDIGTAPGVFDIPLCSEEVIVSTSNLEYKKMLVLKENQTLMISAQFISKEIEEERRLKAEKERIEKEKIIKKELHEAGKTRRTWAFVNLFSGIGFGVAGGVLFNQASKARGEKYSYYDKYLNATTSEDADKYREESSKYEKRQKLYNIFGGISIGLGAAMLTTGIVLFCIDSKSEKEVKKKYNLSVHANPFNGTVGLTLLY